MVAPLPTKQIPQKPSNPNQPLSYLSLQYPQSETLAGADPFPNSRLPISQQVHSPNICSRPRTFVSQRSFFQDSYGHTGGGAQLLESIDEGGKNALPRGGGGGGMAKTSRCLNYGTLCNPFCSNNFPLFLDEIDSKILYPTFVVHYYHRKTTFPPNFPSSFGPPHPLSPVVHSSYSLYRHTETYVFRRGRRYPPKFFFRVSPIRHKSRGSVVGFSFLQTTR